MEMESLRQIIASGFGGSSKDELNSEREFLAEILFFIIICVTKFDAVCNPLLR